MRSLTGVWRLIRFMARRDRIRAPIWIVSTVGIIAASAVSVVELYDTPSQRRLYGELAKADETLKALAGPGYGLEDPTAATIIMNEILIYTFVVIALMGIFLLVRHTRAEEDTDRAELVRSAAVGRLAILVAAFTWVGFVAFVVAAGIVASLLAIGLPAAGTLAFGLATWLLGMVFIATAAATAQVAASARAALAGAGLSLGLSFILRAIGDLGVTWMTWLSPLGWAQSIRAFADERWWVLAPMVLATLGLSGVAVALSLRRDFGAGLLTQRPGPAVGGRFLGSPLAMAARLQRTSLIAWAAGLATLGFFLGIVADLADQLLEHETVAEIYGQAGAGTPTEAFLGTAVLLLGLVTAGFTVSTVLRLRVEETAGRASMVMALPVSRRRWALSYFTVSAVGTVGLMALSGLAVGIGYAARLGDLGQIVPVVGAALAVAPAPLALAAVTLALIGVRPSFSPVAWAAVALSATVVLLAETLRLPQWSRNLSPYQHVPALPAGTLEYGPVAMLILVAAVTALCATVAIGRRDII